MTTRGRVFTVGPGSGRPAKCDRCIKRTPAVGHPWGINDAAWWCISCLSSLGYDAVHPLVRPLTDQMKDEGACQGSEGGHTQEWWEGASCLSCGWSSS